MILIDTNVLLDYLRTNDANLFGKFQTNAGAICGIVRAEILHGARNAKEFGNLVTFLDGFSQIAIRDDIWDEVGDLLSKLRSKGVAVPFTDVVVATVAIDANLELWTRDKQFALIQSVEPRLKLFQEPP